MGQLNEHEEQYTRNFLTNKSLKNNHKTIVDKKKDKTTQQTNQPFSWPSPGDPSHEQLTSQV